MKTIHTPKVYLLGRQEVGEGLEEFLTDHEVSWETDTDVPAQVITETAGRLCYMSFAKPRPGGNKAYLDHIREVGHFSVVEHAGWTLLITGISRTLSHELVRHRTMSYSQISQRYVDESVAEYVEPDVIAEDEDLHAMWEEAIEASHAAYVALAAKLTEKLQPPSVCPKCEKTVIPWHREGKPGRQCIDTDGGRCDYVYTTDATSLRKAARQAARSVLPNATETKITVTANARAWRHFIEQRGSRHAEPEIRKLAGIVLHVLRNEAPNLFGDYREILMEDGSYEITTDTPKI